MSDVELLVGFPYSSLGSICKVCCCPFVSTKVEKWEAILVLDGTTVPEACKRRDETDAEANSQNRSWV